MYLVVSCLANDPKGLIYSVFNPLLVLTTWELPFWA